MKSEIRGRNPTGVIIDEVSEKFFTHRLSLTEFEVKAFLERGALMVLRPYYDIRFRRSVEGGDFILGLETFVVVRKRTGDWRTSGWEYIYRASTDKRNQFAKRWSPPFSLPSNRARIKLKVVGFWQQKYSEAPPEWFRLAGYKDAKEFKARNAMMMKEGSDTILVAVNVRKVE